MKDSCSGSVTMNVITAGICQNIAYGVQIGTSLPALTFSSNVIDGGAAQTAYGFVEENNSQTMICGNRIFGGRDSSNLSVGIRIANSSSTVYNNLVHGGTNATVYGVQCVMSSPKIINNSINGGHGTVSSGAIVAESDAFYVTKSIIKNNILFSTSVGSLKFGYYEYSVNSTPLEFMNNNIFDCPSALYRDKDDNVEIKTISAVQADLVAEGKSASGNISIDPSMQNVSTGDWHLSTETPISVYAGGLDMSSMFSVDMDMNSRTVPWSIGAYEKD